MNKTIQEQPLLELQEITKRFSGMLALDNVSLKIYQSKVTTLMGENGAGKSTVMNVLFGIHKPDKGKIFLEGKEVKIFTPRDAMGKGIAMVHQELNQYLDGTVAENIWMGRYPISGPFVNKNKMIDNTVKILKDLNININPNVKMRTLSISQKQMIEIAKALSYDSKILILDEPTSSLTTKEIENLFKIIQKLKEKGMGILFVSHKMAEVFKISDYIAIFRDGKKISEGNKSQYTKNKIIKDMVGRSMESQYPKKPNLPTSSPFVLNVSNLSIRNKDVSNINFKIKKGEIFGIAGLVGSGRTELLKALFGLLKLKSESKIRFNEKLIKNTSPKKAIRNNFAFVTEERKEDGIFNGQDVQFNINASQFDFYKGSFKLFLRKKIMKLEAKNVINQLSIKVSSEKQIVNSLSGGNQQKVILGRWLLVNPHVLLLDEPTRGIDVGAKYQIYEQIKRLAKIGTSVIVVSSEMQELIGISHRIAVLSNGKLSKILNGDQTNQEEIMKYASKYY